MKWGNSNNSVWNEVIVITVSMKWGNSNNCQYGMR